MHKYLILFLFLFTNAFSQWSNNTAVNNPLVIAPFNQLGAKCISDGNDGMIIVWEDNRTQSSGNRDVYAQRVNKFGVRVWGDSTGIPIGVKINEDERYYDICTDGKGGAIIVWDDNIVSARTILKGQRISSAGAKLWSDTGKVIVNDGNRQSQAKICADNAGGCYIAYLTSEISSSDYEVKANRLDSNGNKMWTNGVWVSQQDGNASEIEGCTTSDNGFFVVWGDPRNSKITWNDLYCQKIGPSGNAVWQVNGIPLCTSNYTQQYERCIADNSGGAFIVWNDNRNSDSITTRVDIFCQRMNSTGTPVFGTNGKAICTAVESQYRPDPVTDMKGGVIVNWNDFRNGPSSPFNIDIYAQRFDSLGNMKWTADGKQICDAPLSQNNNRGISDGNFGSIITWDDRRAGTSIYDIYAQRIDSNGNLLWSADDILVSNAAGNQYSPKIVKTNDGAIICFEDTRTGLSDYNLYTMKILNNGGLVGVNSSSYEVVNNFSLKQNYPNPFNPVTTIKYELKNSAYIQLKIYDVLGSEVAQLVNEKQSSGAYEIKFDGSSLSSGVYFYKLISNDFSEVRSMILIK
ncbi:MAG: T9SS type A sorting domain-containing protein [Bacteroidetes bacterium]|nr:T9SS type A sorting domain-containing protein [Bacteroidota bacterium]